MIAMILAAGRGERLRPLTDKVPKALVEVRGEKLIDRHLHMLAAAGVRTVVINLGWLGEAIAEHVGSGSRFGLQAVYSPEYDQVLETGGGLRRALPMLGDEPFWVVNSDIFTDFGLPGDTLADDQVARLVLVPRPAHRPRGDFGMDDGRVTLDERRDFTFSGIAQYRPAFFDGAPAGRYSVAPMLMAAAAAGTLGAVEYRGTWEDIGTPERLAFLNRG